MICVRRGGRMLSSLLNTHHHVQQSRRTYWQHKHQHHGESRGGITLYLSATLPFVVVAGSFFKRDSREDKLKKELGMCTMHLHQAEPELAKPHFEEALKLVQDDLERTKHAPVPSREIVFLMDQLGNIALQLECYSEAVKLYMGTINGLALNGMERSNRTITELFLKVGQIYAIMGEYKLAELSFIHCVQVTTAELANTKGEKNPDVITLAGLSYEGLGKVYLSMEHPENALNMYKHALEFAERVLGPSDSHIPVLMNDLATVHERLEQYDLALDLVEKAIERAKVTNVTALPAIMCNRATINMYRGNFEEARALYTDLLQSCRKSGDHVTMVEIRNNLNILDDLQRKRDEQL